MQESDDDFAFPVRRCRVSLLKDSYRRFQRLRFGGCGSKRCGALAAELHSAMSSAAAPGTAHLFPRLFLPVFPDRERSQPVNLQLTAHEAGNYPKKMVSLTALYRGGAYSRQ